MKKQSLWTFAALLSLLLAAPTAWAQFDFLKGVTGGKTPTTPTRQIAYFKLKGPLLETPVNVPPLFSSEKPQSLKGLLERLKEARQDPAVVAVVIDVDQSGAGLGQLEELHDALRRFAAVDKDVFVHADSLTTRTYALATAASHISITPTGDLWLLGLYGEAPYLRGALDKLGVTPDFEQCGDFKSAAESITRHEPSEPSRKMTKWLLDSIYENLVGLIADGRKMKPDRVRELIDGGPYTAEEALRLGLIDAVRHRQDFVADIKKRGGEGATIIHDYGDTDDTKLPSDNFFAMFEFLMKMMNPAPKKYTNPSVAVVYVEGAIMTGTAERSPFGGSEGAFSTSIRRALDKAAEDNSVKAVVLRVDSPGGSALASEIILDATRRVAERKPLIVSMGNVAGSGGYYVTCAAETVFADKHTITASIGVIGGKLVTTDAWEKIGINWHAERRGEMAGMMSTASTFSDAERAKIRHYMEYVYDVFKKHVMEARGDRLKKPLDELAGGRVFTGAQALELGLVDRIGGLDDAIKYASGRAGMSDFDIRVIPEPPGIFDLFMGGSDDDKERITLRPTRAFTAHPTLQAMLAAIAHVDPERARTVLRALLRIELIQKEGVITMMPEEWLIR